MITMQHLLSDQEARTGEILTAHGSFKTPCFMPVGTYGAVKGLTPRALKDTGCEVLLCNAYHLMERPTIEVIHKRGGLRKFTGWNRPILTDSGGFQTLSLKHQVNAEGILFTSPINGQRLSLTPKHAVTIQYKLDATLSMQLDYCVRLPASENQTRQAMELSWQWGKLCKEHFIEREGYGLFGIIQGGSNLKLRRESLEKCLEIHFHGYAIGGVAVGERAEEREALLSTLLPLLPSSQPRYLMGVGKPRDILDAIKKGVDMFDCVYPTRCGRHGLALTQTGPLSLLNSQHKDSSLPLDPLCACYPCQTFCRAFLHHLFKRNDPLAGQLLSFHNLFFYQRLLAQSREAIANHTFSQLERSLNDAYPA